MDHPSLANVGILVKHANDVDSTSFLLAVVAVTADSHLNVFPL
jgi:hypothetical protein